MGLSDTVEDFLEGMAGGCSTAVTTTILSAHGSRRSFALSTTS